MSLLRTKETGLGVEKQKPVPLIYEEVNLGFRVDILVENKVIVEAKSVDELNDIHLAQILTFLKLTPCKFGLLINFIGKLIKNGC